MTSQSGSIHKRTVAHHRHGAWVEGVEANTRGGLRRTRVCGFYVSCRYTQVWKRGKWVKA